MANAAIAMTPGADPRAAAAGFEGRPFAAWGAGAPLAGWPADAVGVLNGEGMVLDRLTAGRMDPHVELAASPDAILAWARVVGAGYLLDPRDVDRLAEVHAAVPSLQRYVAWRDGVAAAVVLLAVDDELVAVHALATMPRYRRSGIAEALCRVLLDQARTDGRRIAVAHTRPVSRAIAARLGFEVRCPVWTAPG